MGGYGFDTYDRVWDGICEAHGWSRYDCAGDHWDALSKREKAALSNSWHYDCENGAFEYDY